MRNDGESGTIFVSESLGITSRRSRAPIHARKILPVALVSGPLSPCIRKLGRVLGRSDSDLNALSETKISLEETRAGRRHNPGIIERP